MLKIVSKKIISTLLVTLLMMSMFMCVYYVVPPVDAANLSETAVTASITTIVEINVRKTASSSSTRLGSVDSKTTWKVSKMKEVSGIMWFYLPDKGGWVVSGTSSKDYATMNPLGTTTIVSDGYLNVRETPSSSASRITKFYDGDVITVYAVKSTDDWYYTVDCGNGNDGWFMSKYSNGLNTSGTTATTATTATTKPTTATTKPTTATTKPTTATTKPTTASTAPTESQTIIGKVKLTCNDYLTVRQTASTSGTKITTVNAGTIQSYSVAKTVSSKVWYYLPAYNGWILGTGYTEIYSSAVGTWKSVTAGKKYLQNNGSYATGWVTIDGTKHYFDSSGVAPSGWTQLESKGYNFNNDGSVAENPGPIGDSNCSGSITSADTTNVQTISAMTSTTSTKDKVMGDVSGDAKVSIRDATYLQLYLAKRITTFPTWK